MVEAAVTEATFKTDARFDGLDYHALNAMLNLYGEDGQIQFDADKRAAREYFLQHVNQNTVFFHSSRSASTTSSRRSTTRAPCSRSTRSSSSSASTTAPTPRSSASRRSSARSSTTRATR
jgi:hypothetical protein